MPIQKVRFWDPEHWRFRAEETRTVADQMTHEEARTIMRRIAMDYDRLAKLAARIVTQSFSRAKVLGMPIQKVRFWDLSIGASAQRKLARLPTR